MRAEGLKLVAMFPAEVGSGGSGAGYGVLGAGERPWQGGGSALWLPEDVKPHQSGCLTSSKYQKRPEREVAVLLRRGN